MSILDKFRHNDTSTENEKDTKENTTLADELKKDEENIDNQQTTVTTSTVNKKVVVALFSAFVVATIGAFIMASSSDKDDSVKKPEVDVGKSSYTTASNDNTMDKIPNNYDSLAEHEQKNRGNAKPNNNNNNQYMQEQQRLHNETPYYSANNSNTSNANGDTVRYSKPLPILSNQTQVPPGYVPQNKNTLPAATQKEKEGTKKQEEKNIWASAIGFLSLNKDKSTSNQPGEGTEITSTSKSTIDNDFSYLKSERITDTTITAGTIINTTLLSGINSQIGGQIMAQINNNVYDSLTGNNLLIPAGSRIIGEYAGGSKMGQSRVDIAWNSLIFPDGYTYNIQNMFKSVDSQGYAGIEGDVNNHMGKQIGAGVLASAIGALGNIASGNNSSYSEYGWRNSGDLAAQGATTSLINTASKLFEKQMNIDPEITINPGMPINIMAINNIVF